jgi:predicted O-methyltransferase YrrM
LETLQDTDDFPQACRNLAELLYKEAGLKSSSLILDVGHGSGDSLLLLAKEHSPRLLHGVTTVKGHALRAEARLKSRSSSSSAIRVYHDDAVRFLKRSSEPTYDYIFALDCAYHFQTRKAFLRLCHQRLLPGGKVALVDLAASHPYPSSSSSSGAAHFFTPSPSLASPKHLQASISSRFKHIITTTLSGVPLGNLVPIGQLHIDLTSAGFDDITIKDTSHLVFPGFARFLKGYGKGEEAAWRGGGALQGMALRSFGSIVQDWSRGGNGGMVRSVLVVAAKS